MRTILPIIDDMPQAKTAEITDPLNLLHFHRNSDGSLIAALPCPRPSCTTITVRPEKAHPERWATSMGGLTFSGRKSRSEALWVASAMAIVHLAGRQHDHAEEASEDAMAILMHLQLRE